MLPNPYVILGLLIAFIGGMTGAFFYGEHVENLSWEVSTSKLKIDAAAKLADANARAAAADAKSAALALQLDNDHDKAIADIQASAADFNEQLSNILRDLQRCRSSGGRAVPVPAKPPGQPTPATTGSDGGHGRPDLEAGERLRSVTKMLQADVKECWAWAASTQKN